MVLSDADAPKNRIGGRSLSEIGLVVPWASLLILIKPFYPRQATVDLRLKKTLNTLSSAVAGLFGFSLVLQSHL